MKTVSMTKKIVAMFIIALILEILVFNFSTVKSLGNDPVAFSACIERYDTESGCEIIVDNLDMKISNLWINTDIPADVPVTYHITLTDDGNYYEYYLPEAVLTSGSKACNYVNLYPYGNVHYLKLTMDCPKEWVKDISANVKRPLLFNWGRFVAIFVILVFIFVEFENRIYVKVILTAVCMILWIGIGLFLTSSHKTFSEDQRPHHQQYKELAHVLKDGKVYLDYEPSEGLVNAPNPYDTIYLQANQIDYKADYAYYNGKYYVYFGIVPEVIAYLPYYLLTGRDLANHTAVFLFYSLYVMGIFGFFSLLWRRYFKDIDYGAYLLVSSFAAGIGNIVYVVFTADIYSVPIMAGLAFTALGLFFWMLAQEIESRLDQPGCKSRLCMIIGSLCMALVAGCRPQMLMYSLLIIPIFWPTIKGIFKQGQNTRNTQGARNVQDKQNTQDVQNVQDKQNTQDVQNVQNIRDKRGQNTQGVQNVQNIRDKRGQNTQGVLDIISLICPYIAIAIPIMYYNYARFGSVFDFGATYSLTNNDMNLRGFSIERLILSLGAFLFKLPNITGAYPFLKSSDMTYSYMGKLVTEYFFGGVLISNVLMYSLLWIGKYKKTIKDRGLWLLMGISVISSLIICIADANTAGILQRYTADFVLGFIILSSVMLFLIWGCEKSIDVNNGNLESANNRDNKKTSNLRMILKIGLLLEMVYSFLIVINNVSGINLYNTNPELFNIIWDVFRF